MIRAKVREWVERHALLPQGGHIVAACSGGPDSLALVDLLDGFRREMEFTLFVAHLDHGLRGEASRQDADFVCAFCAERHLPFFGGAVDVSAEVLAGGGSVEEVARRLRYDYLRQVAAEVGGAVIATGHHRDDQAETVLMNLIRGSGGRGLGAMRPRQGDVIRPLLCLTRSDIEDYCEEQGLRPRIDSSNGQLKFRRNRIRHELAPLLRREYNPGLTETLCRTADILSDEQNFMRSYVEQLLPELAKWVENGYCLEATTFASLHVAVQRELLLRLLDKKKGSLRGITFTHVEQIRELFLQERGSYRIDLPGGLQARKSYQRLFLGEALSSPEQKGFANPVFLPCPGDMRLPELGLTLRCAVHAEEAPAMDELGADKVAFDVAALNPPLFVRGRQPGDQFRPLGAPGGRKLKKLFIDLKIPREQRDTVPLVCDGAGILWVMGRRRSERGRITETTTSYITIECIKAGGNERW